MKLLFVDDNEYLLGLFIKYFGKKGIEVIAIHKPTEVMDCLRKHVFHAVILDIDMDGLDGITLLREHIRIDPEERIRKIPVIMITSHGYDADLMEQCKAAGCNAYVSKGLEAPFLEQMIRESIKTVYGESPPSSA